MLAGAGTVGIRETAAKLAPMPCAPDKLSYIPTKCIGFWRGSVGGISSCTRGPLPSSEERLMCCSVAFPELFS